MDSRVTSNAMIRYQARRCWSLAVRLLGFSVPYGIGNPSPSPALQLSRRSPSAAESASTTTSGSRSQFCRPSLRRRSSARWPPCSSERSRYAGDFPVRPARIQSERVAVTTADSFCRWGIYTCIRAIYGAAAGFAAAKMLEPLLRRDDGSLIVATVTAALVAEPLDLAFAALTLKLRTGQRRTSLRTCAPMLVVSMALYTPIVAALTVAYTKVSPWTLPLFFLPALAAQRLFGLYQEQRQLAGPAGRREHRPGKSQPLVRHSARHDAGRTGPLHRRPFSRCRDLCKRHRSADGIVGRGNEKGAPRWSCPRHRQDRPLGRRARKTGRPYA